MGTEFWAHPEYGTLYGTKTETPTGRLCWPSLVTPKKGRAFKEGEKPVDRFEATILLPKEHPKTETFLAETKKLAKAMADQYNKGKKTKVTVEEVFQDGDGFDMEKYPYYKDCWVMVARNVKQPQVTDRDGEEIASTEIKGGMKVTILFTPLFTSHGLSFKLELVRLVKDDNVRFGGGQKNLKEFLSAIDDDGEDVESEETEEVTEDEADETEEEEKIVKKNGKTAPVAKAASGGRGKQSVSRLV